MAAVETNKDTGGGNGKKRVLAHKDLAPRPRTVNY